LSFVILLILIALLTNLISLKTGTHFSSVMSVETGKSVNIVTEDIIQWVSSTEAVNQKIIW
jgi:hypothetical protein